MRQPAGSRAVLGALLLASGGCVATDEARTQSLLNQRGFGERFVGDAQEQYYLGLADSIAVLDVGHPELAGNFVVRMDGVIDHPLLGEVYIAGLTLPDVAELLNRRLREYITTANVDVQLLGSGSKFYYVEGEVGFGGGRVPLVGGETLFQVVMSIRPPLTADKDRIRLIRADPVNPLIFEFDYDDMVTGGWSRGNINVKENDIIYLPPNLIGLLSLAVEYVLTPVQRGLALIIQANRAISVVENFGDPSRGRRNNNRFGGFGFGGFFADENVVALEGEGPLAGSSP